MVSWNQGKAVDAQTKKAEPKKEINDKEADEAVLRAAKFLKTGVAPGDETDPDDFAKNPKNPKKK